VFEGIRCYETKTGPAIFRVREHMQRLVNSGKIYRLEVPFNAEELSNAAAEVVRVNKMASCYIRPIALRGYGDIGVGGLAVPIEVYIACWEWGRYLGPEAIEQGVDVCVSSWNRMAPNTLPSMAKAASNYMNSQLIHMEAHANGYTEGIALDTNGYVSEGSGENIFLALDGVLYTPPVGASVLTGITRNSVIALCEEMKIPVREQMIPREMLYIADEVFFTGTAAEISPLRSIDRIKVGKGSRGPITKALQEEFFAIVSGTKPDRHNWLTPVSVPISAGTR
jgi:branched-chain amino acid aminotransferase